MNINKLVWTQLSLDDALKPYFDDPSVYLTDDPETIARRQRELTCLMENPKLAEAFEQLAVRFDELEALRTTHSVDTGDPLRILRSIRVLETFRCSLQNTLTIVSDQRCFENAAESIQCILCDYPQDYEDLWSCYDGVNLPGSLTYRVEVDELLDITRYRLIAVHSNRYTKPRRLPLRAPGNYPMVERFIITRVNGADGSVNIETRKARTNRAAQHPYERMSSGTIKKEEENVIREAMESIMLNEAKAAISQLNTTVRILLSKAAELQRRTRYFVGALGYIRDLQKVCTVIFPEVCTSGGHIRELSHPRTLLRREYCVPNDVSFDEAGIRLLMGANRGGKTTYLRSVGAAQLLFQMGLPIPAREARMTPVSQVICVFASDERTGFQSGRLGQELNALRDALIAADEHSLVLFNEPLTGTSKKTCETLCREFLSILKVKGARGLWVTHLFGMVRDAEAMNRELPGRPIGFLHVLPHAAGGFKVRPGMEEGVDLEAVGSHAREMLEEEGVVL